jgi:hypothetical protein
VNLCIRIGCITPSTHGSAEGYQRQANLLARSLTPAGFHDLDQLMPTTPSGLTKVVGLGGMPLVAGRNDQQTSATSPTFCS